ncbi:unnamed protein product [Peronospora belbahrii]|uniref:PH domain-containing protein n=1 Tax=Peronospora belbahrii TaxID=622444 RepID=A0ABN8CSM7_9STRA|nr:unnamed protein product [Peronospora belbahrii]
MAREKGASSHTDRHQSTSMRRLAEVTTPFDRHLVDVYAGRTLDGLAFFKEHGYFDVSDTANTVQMFRENVGLNEFWDDRESLDRLDSFERATVYPFGLKSKVPSSRIRSALHRTNSGRCAQLDVNGFSMTEDDLLEMEREDRLKVKSLELDEDDEAELENEVVCMKKAIEVIRVEKHYIQQVLTRALTRKDSDSVSVVPISDRYTTPDFIDLLPIPSQVAHLDLPPYCGNLFVLRESIALLCRSWSKRWCILDFQSFKVTLYKRSYWQSRRGELDLRLGTKIVMMGRCAFCVEFLGGPMLFIRARNEKAAVIWVQLMHFAMQTVQGNTIECDETFYSRMA